MKYAGKDATCVFTAVYHFEDGHSEILQAGTAQSGGVNGNSCGSQATLGAMTGDGEYSSLSFPKSVSHSVQVSPGEFRDTHGCRHFRVKSSLASQL